MGAIEIDTSSFRFIITAIEPMILPGYKGSTLRGGFGSTFRRIVCIVKDKECLECLLRAKCIYSYVFETPPPADTKVMRKYEAAPHPFILEPPPERRRGYKPGDEMVFGLTLIGRAIDYLPYFIYTFEELGKTGLGKGRGRFELKTVVNHVPGVEGKAVDRIIYSSTTKMLSDFQKVPLPLGTISFDDTTPETSRLTLNFLTPTRISHNGHLTDAIEFHMIVRNLMRRISLLAYFHGNGHGLPDLDFNEIIEKAKGVKVIRKRLRRYNWERYSGRQERRISMDGFVGSITFEGEIEPFMPMIKAGEVLHIGKGTVFGLGRYKVQQEH